MEITVKGEPKEIAALVLAIQERRTPIRADMPTCSIGEIEHKLSELFDKELSDKEPF